MDGGHLMAGVHGPRGGRRRINAAGQGGRTGREVTLSRVCASPPCPVRDMLNGLARLHRTTTMAPPRRYLVAGDKAHGRAQLDEASGRAAGAGASGRAGRGEAARR